MKQNFKPGSIRMGLVFLGLLALFLLVLCRAYFLQIHRYRPLHTLAENQQLRLTKRTGVRGDVLDRNGRLLASSLALASAYADPRKIADKKKAAKALGAVLDIEPNSIYKALKKGKSFVWLRRRMSPTQKLALSKLNQKGVYTSTEYKRFYPNHSLLSQTLGLVSIDGQGISGLELTYDSLLKPQREEALYVSDARYNLLAPLTASPLSKLKGKNLTLTIDAQLQFLTERALQKALLKHKAKRAWAILMDTQNGELLAVANLPSMNPNFPGKEDQKRMRNNAFSFVGEPGSLFKIITYATALELGLIQQDELIDTQNGRFRLGRFTIKDVAKRGIIPIHEAFKLSSNVAALKIAKKIGSQRFYDSILRFGFTKPPELDLFGVARGYLTKPSTWRKERLYSLGYGYGIMTSSLQLLLATSAIANNGLYTPPKLILQGPEPDKIPRRVISEKTAKIMQKMMANVTTRGGTGSKAAIAGVQVAGKSGTTEKLDEATKRYDRTKHITSFIGFAPALNPRFAAIVVVDEPADMGYGGTVAAPVFREIMEAALSK